MVVNWCTSSLSHRCTLSFEANNGLGSLQANVVNCNEESLFEISLVFPCLICKLSCYNFRIARFAPSTIFAHSMGWTQVGDQQLLGQTTHGYHAAYSRYLYGRKFA